VYVMQPLGFQDPEFLEKVYKVEKAMYGLHQAPRAWYVYVDDIIFGSSNPQLCREFEALMHDKFQMSAMGKLTFFLGLQVLQKKDGIFLSQDKYVGDILKKFVYSDFRSMIGSLMYLIASRPDIIFAVCACATHQVTPKECHLHVVKRIFRYLKGHPKLGLWYPKESPFDLVAYSDSDYGGATQDKKSTSGGCQFLGRRIESTDQETKIIATVDGKPRTISESSLRRHLKLNDEEGGEGLANPIESHHTHLPQEHQSPQSVYSPQYDSPPLSHQTIIPEPIPHDLQALTKTLTPRRLTKRAIRIAQSKAGRLTKRAIRIAQSKALSPDADEPASLSRDDRYREAFPTISSLDARQDRENIAKTSAMPHESSLRRTKKEDVKSLFKRMLKSQRGIIDIGEELGADKSTEKGSNDTEEMVNVLSSIEAANILSSGGAASVSLADVFPTAGVPTVSRIFPIVSAIFTTASVVTPYTRRSRGITIGSLRPMKITIISAKDKGKEKVTETEVPKKKKLQEQIDAQVAREMEEEFARENQRLSEQAVRDSKIAIIHAEKELKLMIEGLDRSNEVIAKHLSEYKQAKADLSVGEKIDLISEAG
nr:hypothetical protein [Tanacetum cinerariifolium]